MGDRIYIRDLVVDCVIGTLPRERSMRQRLEINVVMSVALQAAGESDDLKDTVDYRAIRDQVVADLSTSSYFLIEAVAEHVAGVCLAHQRVAAVTVTFDKPGALTGSRTVAVEIERVRGE